MPDRVEIYDTTLRDGTQAAGLSPTVGDKLRVAALLDRLGVHFIEGGWPGANPKDDEFFDRAADELDLANANLVAFGSTRRPGAAAEDDEQLQRLIDVGTEVVCIVGKSWLRHVTHALRVSDAEGIAMVRDSIEHLRGQGRRVFFDAEHFFDGYRDSRGAMSHTRNSGRRLLPRARTSLAAVSSTTFSRSRKGWSARLRPASRMRARG